MKTLFTLLLSLASIAFAGAAPTPPPQPITAAVLNFQVSGNEFEHKGAEAALLLNAELSAAPNLILVERQEIDKILGEQELGVSGNVTPDTAAKVGQLTGAKAIITGRVFGAESKFYLVAKIIGTETGRVYGEMVSFSSPAALDQAAKELAPKIVGVLEKRGDTLLAKVEDPAARLQRLKQAVTGKKLPTVSVRIPEQHIGRAVNDPAAQTEMILVLKQLGVEVVEPDQHPGVVISGEAFSELAGRRGALVSCRSRVEIKMSQPATGKLLRADRQTDVGIDLAENVAGKTALENAALKLLDRLVPDLAQKASEQ
jgi:hypothetical protein